MCRRADPLWSRLLVRGGPRVRMSSAAAVQPNLFRYQSFLYQAESWKKARRVVAKVEFHCGELFPPVGLIVANLETDSRAVVRFCNQRGAAEQWIREGKQAVRMTRLGYRRFRSDEVRLWLSVIAYNRGNLWRGVPSGPGAAQQD